MATDLELVGRAEPIATLRSLLDQAATGRGRLVVLSGEPGIGKSALTQFVAREADARGAKVVFGRAWELGEAPPYFPLAPCLASLGIALSGSDTDPFRLWERVVASLAVATERMPLSQPAISRAPSRAPAKSPPFVLWIIEDIHAADLGTLDLLTLLAQPLAQLGALVVVTARMQDPRITDRVGQRLLRMTRDGLEVSIGALSSSDVAVLAERTAQRSLPPGAGRELAELTGGNPLFVIECARAFAARGGGTTPFAGLPQTVRQVVTERLRLLSAAAIEVLSASAVLGRESAAATVGRMLNRLPAQVIDALHPALRAGIISETRPGRFSFTHILVRDAVEEAILPTQRADLHARAELALAAQGDGVEILVERARHALSSMGDGERAIGLALRAARLLDEQGAFDRAYAMYERIADARRAGVGGSAGADEALFFARVAQKAGKFGEAQRLCEELIRGARAASDAELLARAALVMGSELRPAMVSRPLVDALEEAARAIDHHAADHPLACVVRARLAAALQPAPDPAIPVAMARDAISRARALGDETVLLDVLHLAGAALVDVRQPDEVVLPLVEETLDRALAVGDISKAVRALGRASLLHAELGNIEAWSRSTDRVLELSEGLTQPGQRWRPLLLSSMRALARGDVGESDQILVEVRQIASVSDDPALALSLSAHEGGAARILHRDDRVDSLAALGRPMPSIPFSDLIFPTLIAGYHARIEDRQGVIEQLARLGTRTRPIESGFFGLLLAEAHAFAGHVDDCVRLRACLAPTADRHVCGGHVGMTYEGPVVRVLGILDSVIGDHVAAVSELAKALAIVTAAGLRVFVAQCAYDLGNALVRAGRAAEAMTQFATAATLAEEIGMPGLALRARAKAPGPAAKPSPSPPAAARSFAMTCEGDVWRIVFEEHSFVVKDNRGMQLLARLVEHKTEEVHVLTLSSDEGGVSLVDNAPLGEIDARARAEYKTRLRDLEEAIDDAERHADAGRVDKLAREKSLLESELARAFGLGGKARAAGSPSERARVNTQRRLKDAILRISECDEAAGRFLEKAVRTGTYCCFIG